MELSVQAEQALGQVVVEAIREAVAALPDRTTVRLSDLEHALEGALRQAGRHCLERVLAEVGTGYCGPSRPCPCGSTQTTDHYATARWQTVLDTVQIRRAAYHCPTCGTTAIPLDEQLDLPADHTSPHLRTRLSLLCAVVPFAEATHLLAAITGVLVSPKRAQLVSERLGADLEHHQATAPLGADPEPAPTRLYLGLDGVMYCTTERDSERQLLWREAKVGVFFAPLPSGVPGIRRRSRLVDDGPLIDVADPAQHSYVVHLGDWQGLATKIWQEGQRRGLEQVSELVVLGDGAAWIDSLQAEVLAALPIRVTRILDLRHAEAHLWAAAEACLGTAAAAWISQPLEALRQGHLDDLLTALHQLQPDEAGAQEVVGQTCQYYEQHRAHMAYAEFRAQGYQIGSGLAESACKRLVSQRAKGPGMHWTVAGAQAIATLRATYLSGRWQEVVALACAA